MALKKISLSLVKRNAPYRGPRSSDSWNDTVDEVANDLASIVSEWNSNLQPLLDTIPDGTLDVSVDAFTNGLDGSALFTDHDATNVTDNGYYWDTPNSRPMTVKESISQLKGEVDVNYNDLSTLISAATSGLTDDQKRGIGIELFADSYTFTGTSIYSRSYNNYYNTVQLAKDVYGPTIFSLDNDGAGNLGDYSVGNTLDNLLRMHDGTWPTPGDYVDLGFSHQITNADIIAGTGAEIEIDQTKIDNSNASYDDTYSGATDSILDDLNYLRTYIKDLKGTATWNDAVTNGYVGGPTSLDGHIGDSGGGTPSGTNPHGLLLDDIDGPLSWANVNKTGSNLIDLATRSHTDLTSIGTNTHAQIDTAIAALEGASVDHGTTTGLGDDDHVQYLLVDGTRAMTGDFETSGDIKTTAGDILVNTTDIGGGSKVLAIGNASVVPSFNPTAGGIIYVENGELKYLGDLGTITVLGGR